jgi:hypothetical protein
MIPSDQAIDNKIKQICKKLNVTPTHDYKIFFLEGMQMGINFITYMEKEFRGDNE